MASSHTSADVGLGVGIFLLALGTAVVHLYMGLSFGNTLFVLNGLGYLGLLAVLQLPIPQLARFRVTARWALVGYTALTIVLWALDDPGMTIGYFDKAIHAQTKNDAVGEVEWEVSVDDTVVRDHQHAAGARSEPSAADEKRGS